MSIVAHRKIFYGISLVLVAASFTAIALWGLKPGIDFTGGTLVEASYDQRPAQSAVIASLSAIDPAVSVRPSGDSEFIVRMKAVDQTEKAAVMTALSLGGSATSTIKTFDSIGPVLGVEALKRSIVSIVLVILGIVLYITWAFRKVSEPVSSWKYGFVAIVSLAHDIVIPLGAFSILGHYLGYEVDTLFVTALLVILGFSVHNTIVVFDRVRENLKHAGSKKPFVDTVGESVSQTFTRSMNTSLTVIIALVSLYILGGSATEHFSLALIIGIVAGTFSSVFIGSPLLVTMQLRQAKK